MADTKICSKCKKEFPATTEYFCKRKREKDGLDYYCKPCNRACNRADVNKYYKKNKEILKKNRTSPVNYKTYAHQLIGHKTRETKNGKLETPCKKCGKWFKPNHIQVTCRVYAINGGYGNGEVNLYCGDECKDACEVFNKPAKTLIKIDMINAGIIEADPHEKFYDAALLDIWSEQVITNAGHKCEKCRSTENLHAHHIEPKSIAPEKALDPANGVCLCKECHTTTHQELCSTGKLRKCAV